jgi:hypothetical protein
MHAFGQNRLRAAQPSDKVCDLVWIHGSHGKAARLSSTAQKVIFLNFRGVY